LKNVFIEVTNGFQNWGKFMVARFDEEFKRSSEIMQKEIIPEMERAAERMGGQARPVSNLLQGIGWSRGDIIVFDLQTCEGAAFSPEVRGSVHYDLEKHSIWVCPMFKPFLEWLYQQDLSDLDKLPKHVDLPEAEFMLSGYRRQGRK
jgi:hypothetical protein